MAGPEFVYPARHRRWGAGLLHDPGANARRRDHSGKHPGSGRRRQHRQRHQDRAPRLACAGHHAHQRRCPSAGQFDRQARTDQPARLDAHRTRAAQGRAAGRPTEERVGHPVVAREHVSDHRADPGVGVDPAQRRRTRSAAGDHPGDRQGIRRPRKRHAQPAQPARRVHRRHQRPDRRHHRGRRESQLAGRPGRRQGSGRRQGVDHRAQSAGGAGRGAHQDRRRDRSARQVQRDRGRHHPPEQGISGEQPAQHRAGAAVACRRRPGAHQGPGRLGDLSRGRHPPCATGSAATTPTSPWSSI